LKHLETLVPDESAVAESIVVDATTSDG
jgi:hypothetical protein